LDQFSPRQSRPHFKIASIAAAGASQSKDRNDKQKTGFFDSIDPKQTQRAIPKYAKGKLDFVPKNREGQPPEIAGRGAQRSSQRTRPDDRQQAVNRPSSGLFDVPFKA
jgi:hypothetical protein